MGDGSQDGGALGIARKGSVVAHVVQLDTEAAQQMLQAGASLVTNPRSNMAYGAGLCGASGTSVALGTDGLDNDLLAEARAYFLRHSEARDGLARETGMRVAAGQELAGQLFGDGGPPRIVPGSRADLVVLDYQAMTPLSPSNVIDHLARGWTAAHVRDTMVGGRFVVRARPPRPRRRFTAVGAHAGKHLTARALIRVGFSRYVPAQAWTRVPRAACGFPRAHVGGTSSGNHDVH